MTSYGNGVLHTSLCPRGRPICVISKLKRNVNLKTRPRDLQRLRNTFWNSFRCYHALELQSLSFISRTVSKRRNITAISTCSHRGIWNRLQLRNRTRMKRRKEAKPTFMALICGQLQLLGALKQAQYNVTDISTCSHRAISNRLPLRNRICQEQEWNGGRRRNQPSWL